ncbi:MAG: HdeD family acid-resistance protein [Saprospiraceae bacterium]
MITTKAGNWWLPALKGVLAFILGILIILQPLEALVGIALFIGLLAIMGGVALSVFALANRRSREDWGWLLAEAIFDILIGIAIVVYPAFSAVLLASLLGVWFIVSSIFQLIYYTRYRRRSEQRRAALWNGIITLLLGIVIVINPLSGAVGLTLVIGIAAFIYGALFIYIAFRYREISSDLPPLYNEHSIQP